ncbi:MAG: DUF4430 domain-containing protein [Clostridia bacterium]|nr:DUF4430 domain-containing protein [Clostridia bacterium]
MKKIISVILCLIVLIAFSACNVKPAKDNPVFATVKITDANNNVILNEECRLPSGSSAADALEVACRAKKITYQNKNGLYDGFNGITSEKENGWLFYYNGNLAEQGLKHTKLERDSKNVVEMRYVNFDEAFKDR